MSKIKIYTDGSARGNPGAAGWGAIILEENSSVREIGGRKDHATNNQMELTGPIEALKYVLNKLCRSDLHSLRKSDLRTAEVEIYSDSKYVILGITQWIENWIKNDWKNSAKKPVLNKELWQELYELTQDFPRSDLKNSKRSDLGKSDFGKIKWIYVKGHNGDKYNERADEIATSFADNKPVIS
ncbi:MAG: ribonuclease H [Patescibacteria group bacterium]